MKQREGGFALIAAIVLIAVLAALTAFVVSMVAAQGASVQLERARRIAGYAAETGLEWGAYRIWRTGSPVCDSSRVLPALAAYPGVQVTVTCTPSATTEPDGGHGHGTITVFRVSAIATSGSSPASPDYAERTRTAIFSR